MPLTPEITRKRIHIMRRRRRRIHISIVGRRASMREIRLDLKKNRRSAPLLREGEGLPRRRRQAERRIADNAKETRRMRASWICWTVMSLLISMRLVAQDTSRVALVIGLHGPGVLLPISSTTAFRLDGSVSRSGTSDVHVWNEGLGMSALFYLQRWGRRVRKSGSWASQFHSCQPPSGPPRTALGCCSDCDWSA